MLITKQSPEKYEPFPSLLMASEGLEQAYIFIVFRAWRGHGSPACRHIPSSPYWLASAKYGLSRILRMFYALYYYDYYIQTNEFVIINYIIIIIYLSIYR